jgi:carbon-monoxide dehydrogenase medium subunit
MKAPAIDYVRPRSLAEAIDLLARAADEARVIAGGQSLVAMMNLRIASPGLLIDIARLPELAAVAEDDDAVTLGACVTHCAIEDGQVVDPSRGLMPRVAATLGYRAIRTRGTIGGSLALSDPSAEWPAVFVALDAEATLSGPNGRRSLKCTEFSTGIFETQLASDEIIESVCIPKLSRCSMRLSEALPKIGRVRERARGRRRRSPARVFTRCSRCRKRRAAGARQCFPARFRGW